MVAPLDLRQFPEETYQTIPDVTNLWQLWEEEQNHFRRLALRWMNGCADDVAESLQRAAVKVWQTAYDDASAIANPMGWLTGLVRHTCLDLHREQRKQSRHLESLDKDGSEVMAHESIATPSGQSPEACLLRCEKHAYIHAAVDALPRRLRTPLILRCCHEHSYEMIAAGLNLSQECVRKRVQEARVVLHNQLRAYQLNVSDSSLHTQWPEAERLFEYDVDFENTEVDDAESAASLPRVDVLNSVSKREEQKLRTLRAYIERHPNGWKMRLALADQLCKMGYRAEAASAYQEVLQKKPRLMSVWLQMGRIYQELGRIEEAAAAYEHALALTEDENCRAYVCGLTESVTSAATTADVTTFE